MNSSDPCPCTSMDRRGFLLLTATAAAAAGCEAVNPGGGGAPHAERVVDAGPASAYAKDGVYAQYRDVGFFLVQRGGHLTALSSMCTHRQCKINAETDRTFYCPCHGSTFDPTGKVTEGPATRNLPVYSTVTNAQGHVLVKVSAA